MTAKAYTKDKKGKDPWMISSSEVEGYRLKSKAGVVNLSKNVSLSFAKLFRWRKEKENIFLVSSTRGNRNVTMVNEELFRFLLKIRSMVDVRLGDLCSLFGCGIESTAFLRIIKMLAEKEFILFSK